MQLNVETPLQDIRITFSLVEVSAFLSMLYISKNVYILHGCVFSAFVKRAPWFWYNMSRLQQLLMVSFLFFFFLKGQHMLFMVYSCIKRKVKKDKKNAKSKHKNNMLQQCWWNSVTEIESTRYPSSSMWLKIVETPDRLMNIPFTWQPPL